MSSGGFAYANDTAMGPPLYDRRPSDSYFTPEWVTEAVIPFLANLRTLDTSIWECACGDGRMAKVLSQKFLSVQSSDLRNYGFGQVGVNFLKTSEPWAGMIVTNPPFGRMAERFIRHALKLTKQHSGLVALLLRHEYDCAKERVEMFNRPPFSVKLVLTSRPRWIEGSRGAPRHNYAWFIWDWQHEGPPALHYHTRTTKRKWSWTL